MKPAFSPIVCSAVIVWAALGTSGCAIRIAEQEVYLRYAPTDDALDLLFIYKGLSVSGGDDKVPEAVAIVRRLVDGRREFSIAGFPGHVDFDDPAWREEGREAAWIVDRVTLVDRGLFVDDHERLSGFQHFRILGCERLVDLWNAQISAGIREVAAKDEMTNAFPYLDERSRELWISRAQNGRRWVRLVDGGLEFDLPITQASWDRVQAELVKDLTSPDKDDLNWVFQHLVYLRHFEIQTDRVLLRFGSPEENRYRLTFRNPKGGYDERLKEALISEGYEIDAELTLGAVREHFESRTLQVR